jgi:hypothetical protein
LIVTSKSTIGSYATLSHCWGSDASFLRLSKRHMDDFEHGIRLQDLRQTFRDAIAAVRWFPILYLWIDSLCIQQSGEGSYEDLQYHASIMDRIYANCILNIAAAWARSPQDGCFNTRRAEPAQPCTVLWRDFTQVQAVYSIRDSADNKLTAVHESLLYKRGWVFQE